jgi:hypothetical protein
MNAVSGRSGIDALPPAMLAILGGGLVGGALDITYAITASGFRGVPAMAVLQSVASGLLGRASYSGGVPTALLGTFLHFFIACCAAAVYYLASGRFSLLVRRPWLSGIAFGFGMWLTMRYVVLPLSAFPAPLRPPQLWSLLGNLGAHLFLFGLPVALFAARARRQAMSA